MQIQVNTGNGVENKDTLERWAEGQLKESLSRFAEDVTRVEVHLSDETHAKNSGGNNRCTMEARLAHHQPLAVSNDGASMDEAFRGANGKLRRLLDSTLGRIDSHRDHTSIRKNPDLIPD
ncbi:MAG: HPF/RaiA family ribosome-associated protein [Comamonadaceae bacterium]|nr:MAG: HPF/RaiA family ribosome-associated protein [Comamonadaceae bacterium]